MRSLRHRRVTTALACLGAVLVLAGGLVVYVGHVVSNSEQFAARATSSLGDDSLRAIVVRRVTAQILAARSELIAVRPVVESAVDAVVRSPPFQSVFQGAMYDLHRSVFTSQKDTFTLRLADVGVLAQAAIRTLAPSVADQIPAAATTTLVSVAGGDFKQVSDVARSINRVRDAAVWTLLGGGLLLVLSVALATERWPAIRRVGFALAIVGLLVVVIGLVARPVVLGRFAAGDARTAAGAVWDAFLSDLRVWALLTVAAGGLLAAAASVLGPQRAQAGDLLRRVARDDPSSRAAGAFTAAALLALGTLAVLAPGTVVTVVTMLAGVALLYVGVRRVLRLVLTLDLGRLRPAPGVPRPGARALRTTLVVVVVVLLGAAAVALARVTHSEPGLAHPVKACNGYAKLCDRRLNEVVFPATHNSMASATDKGWLFPAQEAGISAQLQAGIRGLLIDTHYGFRSSRGVATQLTAETKKLATVVDAVGPEFIASVERLRATIGFKPGDKRGVYLCHAFCEVGATPAVDALRAIRDFLVEHPHEVVVLSVEDDVTPADTETVFRESGLLDLVYQGPADPWPTLRQLIEQDRRVVVFAERETGGIVWYRPQFELMQETPFHFTSAKQLADPASCRPNRGGSGKPLFLVNNWVDTSPAPRPANATTVNAFQTLLTRARRCESERHRLPNLVAIDFYKRGDVLRVAATLNGAK